MVFANGLPFLVTSSRGISLVTIEYLKSRTAKRLVHTLERVFRIYGTAGFIMQTAIMDMEFKKLKDKLLNVILNTTAAQEHVGEIERKIRVVKERARCTTSVLPYNIRPKIMIIELMHFLRYVDELLPGKIRHLQKMEPQRDSLKTQARREAALQSTFWGIL